MGGRDGYDTQQKGGWNWNGDNHTATIQLPRPPLRLMRRKWKEMRKDWWNTGVDLYAEMIEDDT